MTPGTELLLFGVATIEIVVVHALEGAAQRWHQIDDRTVAVSPSLWRELEELVPRAGARDRAGAPLEEPHGAVLEAPLEQSRGS